MAKPCCKSCAQSSVAGKRKKYRSAGVGQISSIMNVGKSSRSKMLISAAKLAGGIAAGQLIKKATEKIFTSSGNPEYISGGAQILGGIILAGLSKNTGELGLGMAASGMSDIVKKVVNIQGPPNGIGLLPFSGAGSTTLPGVAGEYTYGSGTGNGGMMIVG